MHVTISSANISHLLDYALETSRDPFAMTHNTATTWRIQREVLESSSTLQVTSVKNTSQRGLTQI